MNDVFKANISYNKRKSSIHNETVEKSSLVAGRNMNIKSKNGSISISGTDVKVGNDLDLSTKKDITIKASEENYTLSNSSSQMGIGLSADLSKGKIGDLSISKAGTKGRGNGTNYINSTVNVGGKLKADSENLTLSGANVVADKLDIKELTDFSGNSYEILNNASKVVGAIKDGAKATIAVADTSYNGSTDAGYDKLKIMNDVFKANISYNKSKSESKVHNETVEKSSLVSGNNMNIKSKNGNITISGTDVKVGKDLDLSAKKDITIKVSEENFTSSNSSSQMGIGLSADLSKGKIADLSISKVETKGMVAKEATEDTSCRRSKLGFTFI